jgi:oligopeptide/dipeptide ABC transporter ATP-binding protein
VWPVTLRTKSGGTVQAETKRSGEESTATSGDRSRPFIGGGREVLRVVDLTKEFAVTARRFGRSRPDAIRAVDDVSFDVLAGETLGLVGESGSGKSTLANLVVRLLDATSGTVWLKDTEITSLAGQELRRVRRDMQLVFQDPMGSLNPRMKVRDIIAEPLLVQKIASKGERSARASDLLARVGLAPEHGERYPHEFSGGQRQRIGLARALSLNPALIVLDEPVSALDVSVQAQIVNLLDDLQDEFGLSYVFIAHDLSVIDHISDRVAVMYLGRIVELGERASIFTRPRHPYTVSLLSAVSVPDPDVELARTRIVIRGESGHPRERPGGCVLHPRCHKAERVGSQMAGADTREVLGRRLPEVCVASPPSLMEQSPRHWAACHFPEHPSGAGQLPTRKN